MIRLVSFPTGETCGSPTRIAEQISLPKLTARPLADKASLEGRFAVIIVSHLLADQSRPRFHNEFTTISRRERIPAG